MPEDRPLAGQKIAILMESDYAEPEIFYYQRRFAEEGIEVDFVTRLFGNDSITFTGHEWRVPFTVHKSLENVTDAQLRSYSAVIVPAGMVSDRLRYSEFAYQPAPATAFVRRAFAEPSVLVGVICHGMWLLSTATDLIKGKHVTAHINLIGDLHAYGADYVDADVVVDGDLVTGRSMHECHLFARTIIDKLAERTAGAEPPRAWEVRNG
jgi:protease I